MNLLYGETDGMGISLWFRFQIRYSTVVSKSRAQELKYRNQELRDIGTKVPRYTKVPGPGVRCSTCMYDIYERIKRDERRETDRVL